MNQCVRYLSPASLPISSAWLPVAGGHRLYVEEHGEPDGIPVLVLHGGPGSGNSRAHLQFFAAGRYRVVLPDQRGAGRSEPAGCCEYNTTVDLLDDIESLRRALGFERWLVVGGSWGATLGLLYAAAHPQCVGGLLLRNPFLARACDFDAFFGGQKAHFPLAWHAWEKLGAPGAPGAMLPWLVEEFATAGSVRLQSLVEAWHGWESALSGSPVRSLSAGEIAGLLQRYRLQCHYFGQSCFLPDNAVFSAAVSVAAAGLPVRVVQGMSDLVCPPAGATALLERLPYATCDGVPGVGHDPFAPAMQGAMRAALAHLAAGWR